MVPTQKKAPPPGVALPEAWHRRHGARRENQSPFGAILMTCFGRGSGAIGVLFGGVARKHRGRVLKGHLWLGRCQFSGWFSDFSPEGTLIYIYIYLVVGSVGSDLWAVRSELNDLTIGA